MRINAHLDELVRAMVTYKKDFEMRIYPNSAHAFFNETMPMHNQVAARDAWERVLRFLFPLSTLSWHWNYTQLLQHTQIIETIPLFDNFAVSNS